MELYAVISLQGGRANGEAPEKAAAKVESADWIHLRDEDAMEAGAPQNVAAVHRILAATKRPVQFEGGLNLVHTAELILGLGVARVVLGAALHKTEHSPRHFFSRLGSKSVAASDILESAIGLAALGAHRVLLTQEPVSLDGLQVPAVCGFLVHNRRNLAELESVGFEGALVPAEFVSSKG